MNGPHLTIQTTLDLAAGVYSDSRTHVPQGTNVRIPSNPDATRNVRLPRATPSGGTMSRSEDGKRCAIAGTEYLRIVRVSDPDEKPPNNEHKSTVGAGGAITDVAWCHGLFNHKILTSARNGDLIMWDLQKTGPSKYECKTKDHSRSVHKLAVSHIVHHYCITGSADGDLRVWDIREMHKSIMRIHHPTSVRGVAFSPSFSQPLQAIVGLDNGSIYRWELRMGQRGLLDRLPVAHTASVTSLDWRLPDGTEPGNEGTGGLGWIVSAGLDRCVKIWDLSQPNSSANTPNVSAGHIPHKPTYTLHPSFPVRRVLWRPGYECEVAVVSNANAEFGSGNFSEMMEPAPGATYATALGVGAARTGSISTPNLLASSGAVSTSKEGRERGSGVGDAVEIWDARRGWIAKWTVRGSSIEGGVTDIAFRDSHAIWATHSSGMFSQIDLREATKPIDAIPRMAAAWEASGSLTFVADRRVRWEVPYDDIRPGFHSTEERRTRKLVKSIGDEPCRPATQVVGTYASETLPDDLDMFSKLAKAYVFEGQDRRTLCEMNARTAFEVGKVQVAQMWLLLASCLTSLVPELPPTPPHSPPPPMPPALPVSVSAPAAIASNYSFPPVPNSNPIQKPPLTSLGALRLRVLANSHPHLQTRPHRGFKLGPFLPLRLAPSLDHIWAADSPGIRGPGGSRRPSHYRKPSMSTSLPSGSSASPSNTRHIGEGALDDSDSSSSGSGASTGVDVGDEMTVDGGAPSSDDESAVVSPSLMPARMMTASHPSPLSKVATLQHWPEQEEGADNVDDEEASSPSPMSTDTDKSSDEDGDGDLRFKSPHRRQKSKSVSSGSRKRSATRLKSRSRSSTLASLAAPAFSHTLVRQSSRSSILTVTAGETSFHDNNATGLKAEETLRDVRPLHRHQKSQAVSDFLLDQKEVMEERRLEDLPSIDESKLTERRMEFVHAEEDSIREMTWEILREALECFADEGDVQMCAMLAMIAPKELGIGPKRTLRFLESYIDILTRLQLHTCAAYLRKYCQSEGVRNNTLLETQIHTSCGKCRKPLIVSAGTQTPGTLVKGGFAFCLACKAACVTCAICRLPVRSLLFQCSICHHGGHQACYRRYYMEHPMVPIPSSSVFSLSESRGRRRGRAVDDDAAPVGSMQDDSPEIPFKSSQTQKHLGHPCVSGCGHWCWAATEES
ncbi:WD-REPEATS-REGION domain-containing protein [Mycena venus]|uniref:WD-REPEATS-REGION domain-containing protein n=1 Tax=Mycena venus TaxID=2733690 RepID=A0A8H7CJG4_9AGAR|nr:WD-REPEATS-REGION domain-containing protein [Mycena venus]